MKSAVTALVAALLLVVSGCASSRQSSGPPVSVEIQQIGGGQNIFYYRGPISVQYRVSITNPTNQPLTLTRLDLQTIGPGAYSLRANGTPVNLRIPPNTTTSYNVSAWGYARGGYLASTTPVSLRGTAYFQGPSGSFLKMFNENINQM